jgi:hypothetical protein
MYRYSCFALSIESELELPELSKGYADPEGGAWEP